MTPPAVLKTIADSAFTRIQDRFPSLSMQVEREHPDVDALVTIPRQVGLDFPVSLSLQGDELRLHVEGFWLEWVPCTDAKTLDDYVEAVEGVLSDRFRNEAFFSAPQLKRHPLGRR